MSSAGTATVPKRTPPVVIVGAGPTGLSAAYHLGGDALLIEQNDRVGGLCRSLVKDGFTFDCAGHIMFSSEPYVHEMYRLLLGDNVQWRDREAWIYSKGVYTRYPFQKSLYGLPPEVVKECLLGLIEARFGRLRPPQNCSALNECCADGLLDGTPRVGHPDAARTADATPQNFEEVIYRTWGAGIAKHFAIPYNRKLWGLDLKELDTSWLGDSVLVPDLEEILEGALRPTPRPTGPAARFGYPLRGGFQALMDGFLPHLRGPLRLGQKVVGVSVAQHTVTLDNGETIPYERLISTMPLPLLVRSMGSEVPSDVCRAASSLGHVSVRCVHLGIGRERLTDKHWIYYPEEAVFHRVFMQGNASSHCNPPGGFGLTCEITYSPNKPLPCEGDALVRRVIDDCVGVGIIDAKDPVRTAVEVDLPYSYVVYDHSRPAHVAIIRQWMESHSILLAGRYSEWEFYTSDHAFLAGKKAAERCRPSVG